jgi:HAD superfamily hydrolase (TIGR01549 family)
MVKAVFLDAIDTIFEAYPDKVGMYCRAIKKVSGLVITRDQMSLVWNKIVTDTEDVAAREMSEDGTLAWEGFNQRIIELLDYKGDIVKVGNALLYEAWSNPDNFVLFDDVIPALEMLKDKGVKIYCASNENKRLSNFFVHFSIDSYFTDIFTSEALGVEKPNPAFFEKILVATGFDKNEVLHVGDSIVSDYDGAQNVGIRAILVDRNDEIKENRNIVRINDLCDIKSFLEV